MNIGGQGKGLMFDAECLRDLLKDFFFGGVGFINCGEVYGAQKLTSWMWVDGDVKSQDLSVHRPYPVQVGETQLVRVFPAPGRETGFLGLVV